MPPHFGKRCWITRADYEISIFARLGEASYVPFKDISSVRWTPRKAECHRNVDLWVAAHPDHVVVRGWITEYEFFQGVRLTAHSVVQDISGKLFDITPVEPENELYRRQSRFIRHLGDDQEFAAIKAVCLYLDCKRFGVI